MEKRVILAVALSILIIVTFQYLAPTKPIPTGKPSSEVVSAAVSSKESVESAAKKLSVEEVAHKTTINARAVFKIPA